MTAIDRALMEKVAILVAMARQEEPDVEWHTLTVTLNGQHGGADVSLQGDRFGEEWNRLAVMH